MSLTTDCLAASLGGPLSFKAVATRSSKLFATPAPTPVERPAGLFGQGHPDRCAAPADPPVALVVDLTDDNLRPSVRVRRLMGDAGIVEPDDWTDALLI